MLTGGENAFDAVHGVEVVSETKKGLKFVMRDGGENKTEGVR